MSATVYIAPVGHVGARAGEEQPAFRAWADALLREWALKFDLNLATAVAKRSTSQIGRLGRQGLYTDPISVDPAACAVAVASDELSLFFPPAWSEGLAEYLVDCGYDRDMIEEHLLPCDAPLTPIVVEQMSGVLASTRADLLRATFKYFEGDIQSYLKSWRPLAAEIPSVDQNVEVVVASDAVANSSSGSRSANR